MCVFGGNLLLLVLCEGGSVRDVSGLVEYTIAALPEYEER